MVFIWGMAFITESKLKANEILKYFWTTSCHNENFHMNICINICSKIYQCRCRTTFSYKCMLASSCTIAVYCLQWCCLLMVIKAVEDTVRALDGEEAHLSCLSCSPFPSNEGWQLTLFHSHQWRMSFFLTSANPNEFTQWFPWEQWNQLAEQ